MFQNTLGLTLEVSQNISRNFLGQVFNYIMNVQWMKGDIDGSIPSMMLVMMLGMSFMITTWWNCNFSL
jgi:hypothetical protein